MVEMYDIFQWGDHMIRLSGWGIFLVVVAIGGIAGLFDGSVHIIRRGCSCHHSGHRSHTYHHINDD